MKNLNFLTPRLTTILCDPIMGPVVNGLIAGSLTIPFVVIYQYHQRKGQNTQEINNLRHKITKLKKEASSNQDLEIREKSYESPLYKKIREKVDLLDPAKKPSEKSEFLDKILDENLTIRTWKTDLHVPIGSFCVAYLLAMAISMVLLYKPIRTVKITRTISNI